MSDRVLIVGCGDTGRRVLSRLVANGAAVTGLVRTPESAALVRALGGQAQAVDLDQSLPPIAPADLVFYFAPPPRQGVVDTRLRNFLLHLEKQPPRRLVYISTSGVYGECNGAWVDESQPVNPQTDRAKRRVDAEQCLLAWGGPWVILRAPGIYGPGRLPLDKVRTGEPVLRDEDCGWSNRIHIEDLASAALLASRDGSAQVIYNVSDGNPTKMAAYYASIADLLGVAPPPQIDWATAELEFSAMRLSFLAESRRLVNRRITETLGLRLRYADLREGLAASLGEG